MTTENKLDRAQARPTGIQSLPRVPRKALYHWTCDLGTYWLAASPADEARIQIGREDTPFAEFSSCEAAARAFYGHRIGDVQWDNSTIPGPCDLAAWLRTRRPSP